MLLTSKTPPVQVTMAVRYVRDRRVEQPLGRGRSGLRSRYAVVEWLNGKGLDIGALHKRVNVRDSDPRFFRRFHRCQSRS
jgi:hypothetical protein